MEKKNKNYSKKWRRLICMVLVFCLVLVECRIYGDTKKSEAAPTYQFMDYAGNIQPAGGEFTMHQLTSQLKISSTDPSVNITQCKWHTMDKGIVTFEGADTNGEYTHTSAYVNLKAVAKGTSNITCMVYTSGSTTPIGSFNIKITVDAVIDESMASTDNAKMGKVLSGDTGNSIVMNYTSTGATKTELKIGGDSTIAGTDKNQLNMMFMKASDAEWSSDNTGVISVDNTGKKIIAEGAGKTILHAEKGGKSWSIPVYVRPEIKDESGNVITNGYKSDHTSVAGAPSVTVDKGDILDVSVADGNHPEISIGQKIDWVISKQVGANTVTVKDSTGYQNPDYKGEANLIYITNSNKYKVDCKAGEYIVQFYVKGTYKTPGQPLSSVCGAVNLKTEVNSLFSNKENITVNIGGHYNLSEGLNMTVDTLKQYFNSKLVGDTANTILSLDSNEWKVNANKLGTASVEVSKKQGVPSHIPGVPDDVSKITITIHVIDSFVMNVTETTMAVDATLDLHGVIGSGTYAEDSQFQWSVSDRTYLELSSEQGQYVTVKAKKATNTNEYVTATVNWTDIEGVTRIATCKIVITTSASNLKITPETLKLESGSSEILSTSLSGTQNIVWMSSDPTIATVEPLAGNVKATVTGKVKTGDVVITAYNADNRVYATCKVTVVSSVTSLKIDKGDAYTAALGTQYVFMKAVYQPTNATEIEMEWISTNTRVATVDNNGMVTMLSKGETTIQVKPKHNPNSQMATCILTVTDKVMTSIKTDVTKLDMIKGETHQAVATYLPVDASETKMTWKSLNTSVAKVNDAGLITAVGVGSTSIVVSANVAYDTASNPNKFAQAIITVNVRNKLNSIKFASTPIYISAGNSQKIDIVFNPAKDINTKLTWSVSDTSIAKVSKDGVLTGVSEGIASLNVIAEDIGGAGISTMVYVTPKPVYATNFVISPDKTTIHVGEELRLETSFTPKGVTETNLTWDSSDEKIATVDEKGVVTAVAVGEVVISAVYTDAPNGKPITRSSSITVDPPIVNATDFSVSPAAQNIVVGKTFKLTPVFTPADTTNKKVEYQSLDTGVATVDSKGVVKGVGAGDVLIQCQSEDGGFIGTCAVHVDNAIKFSLSPSVRELAVGKTFTPVKVTKPSKANKTAKWKSSNTSIATVNSKGKVRGKRIGNCTITCTLTNYNQSAKCIVRVRKLNSRVSFDKTNIRIGVGQTYRLKKTVWSNNSTLPKLTWKTSNRRVLSVNSSGKIKGNRVGLAKVTVITKDPIHAKAVCHVRVIQRTTSLSLNTDYMVIYVGRSKKLTARFKPANTTIKKVKWKSGNSSIARVTSSGKVRGISPGDTFVTATATDGSNKKVKCYIKVLEAVPATNIVVAQKDMTMKRGDSAKISFTVLPSDTSDGIKFSSDNKRVATINKKGVVHAVGTGNATITILTTSGISATVAVNVVALNKTSLNIRQYDSETLMVFGANDKVTWFSSNSRIATVSNGLVVGKGKGEAYIYAYVNGCKLGCKVTVTSVND